MLVFSRKTGQRIQIGDDIEILITRVSDGSVGVAIKAPAEIRIMRSELIAKIKQNPAPCSCVILYPGALTHPAPDEWRENCEAHPVRPVVAKPAPPKSNRAEAH